mmetsp:Transcript_73607/g.204580  ORF Transcript_73607/g.204580 Transcript_73607/m.204580 type:complete len:216 (-) Transcript_73607:143-790(-)
MERAPAPGRGQAWPQRKRIILRNFQKRADLRPNSGRGEDRVREVLAGPWRIGADRLHRGEVGCLRTFSRRARGGRCAEKLAIGAGPNNCSLWGKKMSGARIRKHGAQGVGSAPPCRVSSSALNDGGSPACKPCHTGGLRGWWREGSGLTRSRRRGCCRRCPHGLGSFQRLHAYIVPIELPGPSKPAAFDAAGGLAGATCRGASAGHGAPTWVVGR